MSKLIWTCQNWFELVKIGLNLSKLVQFCQNWFKLACQNWLNLVKFGSILSKMVNNSKIGLNLSKYIQTWFNVVKILSNCLICVKLVYLNHISHQIKLSKELSLCTLPWRLKGFSVLFLKRLFYPIKTWFGHQNKFSFYLEKWLFSYHSYPTTKSDFFNYMYLFSTII